MVSVNEEAAIDQRGAGSLQGGDAVDQRGAEHRSTASSTARSRSSIGPTAICRICSTAPGSRRVPRPEPADPQLHAGCHSDFNLIQSDSGPPADRSRRASWNTLDLENDILAVFERGETIETRIARGPRSVPLSRAGPAVSRAGEKTRGVIATFVDVTSQAQAEEHQRVADLRTESPGQEHAGRGDQHRQPDQGAGRHHGGLSRGSRRPHPFHGGSLRAPGP